MNSSSNNSSNFNDGYQFSSIGSRVLTPRIYGRLITTRGSTKPHNFMTWTDGVEEVVKLALAMTVGALGQRIYLQSKLQDLGSKVGQLEREVLELKAHAATAATKADLAREVASLQTIMELKLGSLGANMQTLTGLVQRALDRPTKP